MLVFIAETPFGQVPVLYIDDQPLSDSGSIVRFLSAKFGFQGNDLGDAAACEMVTGRLNDVFSKLPFRVKDPKEKEEQTNSVWKEFILPTLQKLEEHFVKKNREYFVCDKLTYADISLMHCLMMAQRDCPQHLTTLPHLCALRDRVKQVDGIKQYLATRVDVPF